MKIITPPSFSTQNPQGSLFSVSAMWRIQLRELLPKQ